MKQFWLIIYDDQAITFDLTELSNDTLETANIAMLQQEGFKVHCQSGDIDSYTGKETALIGYSREKGLFQRLLLEYERRTGKTAKRW